MKIVHQPLHHIEVHKRRLVLYRRCLDVASFTLNFSVDRSIFLALRACSAQWPTTALTQSIEMLDILKVLLLLPDH